MARRQGLKSAHPEAKRSLVHQNGPGSTGTLALKALCTSHPAHAFKMVKRVMGRES